MASVLARVAMGVKSPAVWTGARCMSGEAKWYKNALKAKHVHNTKPDKVGYFGRSVEYTDAKNLHAYHTFYDLENVMSSSRCKQPVPGEADADRMADPAAK